MMVVCFALYSPTNKSCVGVKSSVGGAESSLLLCPDIYVENEDYTDYTRRMWTGEMCLSVWWLLLVIVSRYHLLRYTVYWSRMLPLPMAMLTRLLMLELSSGKGQENVDIPRCVPRPSSVVTQGRNQEQRRTGARSASIPSLSWSAWWYRMWGTLSYWANTPTDRSSGADNDVATFQMIWWSHYYVPRSPQGSSSLPSTFAKTGLAPLHIQAGAQPGKYPSTTYIRAQFGQYLSESLQFVADQVQSKVLVSASLFPSQ